MDGTFDTLNFVKHLREQGVPDKQAEAIVEVIASSREADLRAAATKADLHELELRLKNELDLHMAATKANLRELELRLKSQFNELKLQIGGMIVAPGGILIAIRYFG